MDCNRKLRLVEADRPDSADKKRNSVSQLSEATAGQATKAEFRSSLAQQLDAWADQLDAEIIRLLTM